LPLAGFFGLAAFRRSKRLLRRVGPSGIKGIRQSADLPFEVNRAIKLLIVDNDSTALDTLRAAVDPDDLRLLSAKDAASCLDMLAREQPDIALVR
jgi:hypothetical protein